MLAELPNIDGACLPASEPLRWAVHGGPGAGKTHVVKDVITHDLFSLLHWKQGHDYEVVSLQAEVSDLLKGDTIHHA